MGYTKETGDHPITGKSPASFSFSEPEIDERIIGTAFQKRYGQDQKDETDHVGEDLSLFGYRSV